MRAPALLIAILLACAPSLAHAQQSNFTAYGGAQNFTGQNSDLQFAGVSLNAFNKDAFGFHGELSYENQGGRAISGSVGVSWKASETLRPRIMIGTSSNNQNLLPQAFGSITLEFSPKGGTGWGFRPALAYNNYRNGLQETLPSLAVSRTIQPNGDKGNTIYLEGRGGLSIVNQGTNGYYAGGSGSLTTPSGFSVGLDVDAGRSSSQSVLGFGFRNVFTGTTTKFITLRPSVTFPLAKNLKLYVRGEYTTTDLYVARGGSAGVTVNF